MKMNHTTINTNQYDKIIVAFSGGKDSLACLLHLLEIGTPKNKIELWHHEIDGREGSNLMDWTITPGYCDAIAEAFEIPIYYSWKVGGFECEMLKENGRTKPTKFETPNGEILQAGGIRGKISTRRKFPQVSPDLRVRWCSAYLKIDVCTIAINNQTRFENSKTLIVTGERAEESTSRANYKEFEKHRSDKSEGKKARHVDHWRPVHSWSEREIWTIIERWKVNPHPAYKLGWGRVSCQFCIFGSNDQWASACVVSPERLSKVADYEKEFGLTIHRTLTIDERLLLGIPYQMTDENIKIANSKVYTESIFVDEWELPQGAFGESCGPV
jgi:3'-phosphoadenosine 5'-phosphosulfate sulfotransferase (PAPS reductase)/FAD synthetase